MIQGISRCSACVKRGRRCISARVTTNTRECFFRFPREKGGGVDFFFFGWYSLLKLEPSRVIAEGKKLQAQERDAEEALVKAFRKVEEALAHLNHLRKHRELLTEGTKTMDVGLEAPYIGVEEDVEEEERVSLNRVMAEKSEAVVTASGVRNS